jgi:hypothetical protein
MPIRWLLTAASSLLTKAPKPWGVLTTFQPSRADRPAPLAGDANINTNVMTKIARMNNLPGNAF